MGWTMGLNLLLLMAMVATNLLSVYHLSTTVQSPIPSPSSALPIPDHLLRQLRSLRSSISHLTPSASSASSSSSSSPPSPPSDLLLYSSLSPIASSCHHHPSLLHTYMNYTPFSPCPRLDPTLVESLLLLGCHPLPRRRCFSPSNPSPSAPLSHNPFPSALPDSAVLWSKYSCKSFSCLNHYNPNLGFDMPRESSRFTSYSDELDLPVSQLVILARSAGIPLRVGIDVGGGTGSFAATMKRDYNVTVVTMTMNLGAPYSEAAAIRGVVPMHVPLQQRLLVFDGTMDLVRCGRAVNRWIPDVVLEFMLFDFDRVLRGGGYLWLDHFFSKEVSLEKVYKPLIGKLGYRKVKWAVANKTDTAGIKNKEVYLTALLQKPMSR